MISRDRQTHPPTHASIVWEWVGGGGGRSGSCFEGLDEEKGGEEGDDRIGRL